MFYVANNNLRTHPKIDHVGGSPANPSAGMPSIRGQTTTLGESQPAEPREDILPGEFDPSIKHEHPSESVDLDHKNDSCEPGPSDNRH